MYSSTLTYNVTRAYPYRWLTPAVTVGLATATALFSVVSYVSSGFTLQATYIPDSNATTWPASDPWLKHWPSVFIGSNQPVCQSASLPVGSTTTTNNSALTWTITDVAHFPNSDRHSLPSLVYKSNLLENCKFSSASIYLDSYLGGRSAPQVKSSRWGADVEGRVYCEIQNPESGTVFVNLTASYNLLPRSAFETNQTFHFPGQNISQHSLWWGESLLSSAWWNVVDSMEARATDYVSGVVNVEPNPAFTEEDPQFCLRALYLEAPLAGGDPLSWTTQTARDTAATSSPSSKATGEHGNGISTSPFPAASGYPVDSPSILESAETASTTIVDDDSQPTPVAYGSQSSDAATSVYSDVASATSSSLDTAGVASSYLTKRSPVSTSFDIWPEADFLGKVLLSTMWTDLGQSTKYNILSDAQKLRIASQDLKPINSRGIPTESYANGPAYHPYNASSGQDFSLVVNPSILVTDYLCQVPQRKPWASLIISVVIADLVLLQALWVIVMFVASWFAQRRDPLSNSCETCVQLCDAREQKYSKVLAPNRNRSEVDLERGDADDTQSQHSTLLGSEHGSEHAARSGEVDGRVPSP